MARPAGARNESYDLRDQIVASDIDHRAHAHAEPGSHHHHHTEAPGSHHHQHHQQHNHYGTDEEISIMEDDSDGDDQHVYEDDDDDGSSSLSIPNESIDFDLVYAFHSFAATVDGQANVVKGDSLFLMDDSNSYWWLVRVLKTQEVGYIPAENIETPFERLARLNKHRNVDLASPTQAELNERLNAAQDRLRNNLAGKGRKTNRIHFTPRLYVRRYLPAVWREDEVSDDDDDEWEEGDYEDEDEDLAREQMGRMPEEEEDEDRVVISAGDPMHWENETRQPLGIPEALQPGGLREHQQQAALRAQQQQQLEQQKRDEEHRQQQLQQQQQELEQRRQEQQRAKPVQEEQSTESRSFDPLEVKETRKITVTPSVAREDDRTYAAQEEERNKRLREEEHDDHRKRSKGKMPPPVSSASPTPRQMGGGGKLTKERSRDKSDDDGKKKKSGIFGRMFSSRRDKKGGGGDTASLGSMDSSDSLTRNSEESGRASTGGLTRTSSGSGALSPTSSLAMSQQQSAIRIADPITPERGGGIQVSPQASSLRQRDQQQQALYQQYLNRSPSSPPEAQPNYGLQSASVVMPRQQQQQQTNSLGPPAAASGGGGVRPRPGSLILTSMDGPGVPELSVVRVFAGKNVQTEATFKTVLLNHSTSSADLVRQAIQRFRLPAGEDAGDYYLTIKQVEGGGSAALRADERPLAVFDTLVAETMELPKVKRSSVGSISSITSNLSMHPAITKLPMNDFSDDSAVKFYLNRRAAEGEDDSSTGHDIGDGTLIAQSDVSTASVESSGASMRAQYLGIGGGANANANVTPERFSTPSVRFALQMVIFPADLPDDMVFHPTTEAIVFKDTLSAASPTSPSSASASASQFRRKVFIFPKNVTVAEVIEMALERYGITEGVVDGGDEVEDKYTKRRSSNRVRYGLVVDVGDGRERELSPSMRVVEAFPRPPAYRTLQQATSGTGATPTSLTSKRRSIDAVNLLGTLDDVREEDPVFVLRRSKSYRMSASRQRPLDEIALQKLHRESAGSLVQVAVASEAREREQQQKQKHQQQQQQQQQQQIKVQVQEYQPSRQEIIAAQRAAQRANQHAILSAQSNSVRGTDLLLPGNAVLRSARLGSGSGGVPDRMRYSYVEPDGETYDVSDIVEEAWREEQEGGGGGGKEDLLEGVIARQDALGERLDRVLDRVKMEKERDRVGGGGGQGQPERGLDVGTLSDSQRSLTRSVSPSEYSDDGDAAGARSRSVTPGSAGLTSKMPSAQGTRAFGSSLSSSTSSQTAGGAAAGVDRRRPSIASVMSDGGGSGQGHPPPATSLSVASPPPNPQQQQQQQQSEQHARRTPQQQLSLPKDDFGISHMLAIIDYRASSAEAESTPAPARPVHPADRILFGVPVDFEALHPAVREIYERDFKHLEEIDKMLDACMGSPVGAF